MKLLERRDLLRSAALGGLAAGSAALGLPRSAQAATLKIGAVLPFSGDLELFGEQARIGIDLAEAEINAAGGVLGRPIEVVYRDDRTDPDRANEAARSLIKRDNVLAILGPISSAARDTMAPTIIRFEVPLLYATDYEGGGCDPEIFFFNTVPNQSVNPLIDDMHGRLGTTYYMLGADYIWPRRMFETARAAIKDRGGEVLGQRLLPLGRVEDYSRVIKKIEDANPEILVFALPGDDGVAFVRQAAELGLWRRVTMAFFGDPATYLSALGPAEGEGLGLYGCVPFVARDPSPGVQAFVARVRAMYGDDTVISSYVMTHYNALNALKEGLEKAGEVSSAAAAAGMAGLVYETPTGPSVISPDDHHSALSMSVIRIRKGSLRLVEAVGEVAPLDPCG